MTYVGIIITFVFINNFILTQFLGLCPFIGVSKNTESAVGMGFAVTFVMALASLATWAIQKFVLVPLGLEFLQTITFILVIAALVQLVEMIVQKISPPLYKALGIYLPLITTNCAVLGIAFVCGIACDNDIGLIRYHFHDPRRAYVNAFLAGDAQILVDPNQPVFFAAYCIHRADFDTAAKPKTAMRALFGTAIEQYSRIAVGYPFILKLIFGRTRATFAVYLSNEFFF